MKLGSVVKELEDLLSKSCCVINDDDFAAKTKAVDIAVNIIIDKQEADEENALIGGTT